MHILVRNVVVVPPLVQQISGICPRKIMMDTRDRMEEVGEILMLIKAFFPDGKSLLNDYITPEELWACTSCTYEVSQLILVRYLL
jgi:Fe-S oxidoreductase